MTKYKIQLNSGTQRPEYQRLLHSLVTGGIPSGATDVYKGRNHVVRLTVTDEAGHPLPQLNIKEFHRPHFINAYVYRHLRESKAERSYRNAMALIAAGFATPAPIGFAEVFEGMRLGLSYYVCQHLDHPTLRDVERHHDWPLIMEALGKEMARLHRHGIFFRDFSPGNILVGGDSQSGYTFYYIDLNRMDFGVRSRQKLMRMFRAVIYYDPAMEALARSYAAEMGLNPDDTAAEALKLRNDFEDYLNRKRALKARLRH